VFYTDGVTEAMSPEGELFGAARMGQLVRERGGEPAAGICAAIEAAVRAHARVETLGDDLTLVVLRVL